MLMKKINLKNILAISLIILLPFISKAEGIIRDSEIEQVIKETLDPIIQKSHIKHLRIILLDNPEINAFTSGGKEIYVNSGLIANMPDPDVFKGVMAHEIGHIQGHHVARQLVNLDNLHKKSLGTLALGLIGAIAANDPQILAVSALGTGDLTEKSFLKYSRTYEASADQAAYKLLEESGNSAIGMKTLFEFFMHESSGKKFNKYLLSHPISGERLKNTENFIAQSKYKKSTSSAKLQKKFKRISAKLLAFTHTEPELLLQKSASIQDNEIKQYLKAICNMRLGKYADSIKATNYLLSKNPQDPYYNELKGEILLSFGRKESLEYFDKAVSLVPNDNLMKMNLAIVALNVYRNDPKSNLEKYIPYIKSMQLKEPGALAPYYYLAQYYGLLSEPSLSKLYLAIYYDKQDMREAKRFAKASIKGLKVDTPEYYWAKDIIDREY